MSPENQPHYPNRPIVPEDVLRVRAESFPDEVYVAVNGLIAERLQGQYALISVKGLVQRMVELGLDRKEIKEKGWDKVGAVYKQAGWKVEYIGQSIDDVYDFDPYYSFNSQGPRSR